MGATAEVPKTHLVALALHALGGEGDLETIAVKAHEMFPGQFSWRRFPFPDKDAVRVHLSEAKKKAFGELIIDHDQREQGTGQGTRVKRYALTRAGLEKAQELTHLLADAKVTGSDRSFDYQQIVAPIVASEAFRQFAAGGSLAEIGRERFLLAAKLFADASPFMINGRLAKAQNAISRLPESSERDRLTRFIEEGRDAFGL